eukprot:11518-Pelagococcus_subviridis.AAC.2
METYPISCSLFTGVPITRKKSHTSEGRSISKRTSGWSSKASVGVERRRGRALKPRGGRI